MYKKNQIVLTFILWYKFLFKYSKEEEEDEEDEDEEEEEELVDSSDDVFIIIKRDMMAVINR